MTAVRGKRAKLNERKAKGMKIALRMSATEGNVRHYAKFAQALNKMGKRLAGLCEVLATQGCVPLHAGIKDRTAKRVPFEH